MLSRRSFIYDIRENSWIEGPSLLSERCFHSSCAIQADDGSVQSIIIMGGRTSHDSWQHSNSTEILKIKDQKWIQGPNLPCGILHAACVSLPFSTDLACIIVGGSNIENYYSSDIYGLNNALTEWKHLGKLKRGRQGHIAIPLS